MSTNLKEYLDSTGRLPEETLLGHITVQTVQEGGYPRDEIVALFEEYGLATDFIPPTSTAMDGFKRACNRRAHEYVMSNGSLGFLEVNPVDSPNPSEIVIRALVRREQVRGRPALDFTKVGEIVLYRGVRRGAARIVDDTAARLAVRIAHNDPAIGANEDEWQTITAFAQMVKRDYDRYTTMLHGDAIRKMIRSYLRSRLAAVKIKDSVYFVPQVNADELGRLREAIGRISGCTLDLIPLVDMVDQRDHIIRAFQEDTEGALITLAGDLQRARATNLTARAFTRLRRQYDEVVARTAVYTDALGDSALRTSSILDVVTATITQMSSELLGEGSKA